MSRAGAGAVIGVLALAGAAGVAVLATRAAGPVPMPALTELRQHPLAPHVVTHADLMAFPVEVPHRYPSKVAPGLASAITHGHVAVYHVPDQQVMDSPAESPW